MPSTPNTVSNQDEFQREERRALLSLGLLAIVVSLLVNSATLGFPSLVTTLLYMVTVLWALYALCMMFYFSDDLFSLKSRLVAKELGLRLLLVYPIEVIVTIPTYLIIRSTPSSILSQDLILGLFIFLPFFIINLTFTPRIRKSTSKTT